MNFFIFSSKSLRVFLLFFTTLVTLYAGMSFALTLYVLQRTSAESFTQEIGSKARHMRLNAPEGSFDAIFIGNSRTEYGISSAVFRQQGLDVYNYGVAGAKLSNYAYMLERAVKLRPRSLVLSVRVDELYDPVLLLPAGIRWADIKMIWQGGYALTDKFAALGAWLEGFNAIRIYADQINGKFRSAYNRFGGAVTPDEAMQFSVAYAAEGAMADCKIIQSVALSPQRSSYKCSNGDFIMEGQAADSMLDQPPLKIKAQMTAKTGHLKSLITKTEGEGVRFVLVLEPAPFPIAYDIRELELELGVNVLDYSNFPVPRRMWADGTHLNAEGRVYYSQALATALMPLLRDSPARP